MAGIDDMARGPLSKTAELWLRTHTPSSPTTTTAPPLTTTNPATTVREAFLTDTELAVLRAALPILERLAKR